MLNRFPTKKLEKLTPEKVWFRFKPNLIHLRVFSFVAYQHLSGQLTKKLDDNGKEMNFVRCEKIGRLRLVEI